MGARAVARAETAPPPITIEKNDKKLNFISYFYWRSARTQPRARPCSARQSILLIKGILFDYLIASVAQKLTDLAQIEVRAKLFKNGGVRPMTLPGAQHGCDVFFKSKQQNSKKLRGHV